MAEPTTDPAALRRTPLYDLHRECGAKVVAFAGYAMPVNFADGIIKEHLHTRAAAGLFDVSHMGQVSVRGDAQKIAAALEKLAPADVVSLAAGRQRYALFTDDGGGVLDDLMVQNLGSHFALVVNAACKEKDFAHLKKHLGGFDLKLHDELALLALQGPAAAEVLNDLGHDLREMKFMDVRELDLGGVACTVSRSGYTGEDGFEISLAADAADAVARSLIKHDAVKPIGLGARDSLRLEAGLCLYGHDLTTDTTPVEAGLNWAIAKSRRTGGERAGGFPGAAVILAQLPNKVARRRVGLTPDGRAPVREGAQLMNTAGDAVGVVTSGGFAPSVKHPVSVGYVKLAHAAAGEKLNALVRGKPLPVTVTPLPFVPANFYR